jgi:hypothetical protein
MTQMDKISQKGDRIHVDDGMYDLATLVDNAGRVTTANLLPGFKSWGV